MSLPVLPPRVCTDVAYGARGRHQYHTTSIVTKTARPVLTSQYRYYLASETHVVSDIQYEHCRVSDTKTVCDGAR
eukprot:2182459-Rhodomonas_salina.1